MASQALFFRTCNLITNNLSFLTIRPINTNLLQPARGLKQKTIEQLKMLKIPEKPKRPPTPYLKFVIDINKKLTKENPNLKPTEIIKKSAEEWKNIADTDKEKYIAAFKEERDVYNKMIVEYNAKLTEEQKKALADAEEEKKLIKTKRKARQVCKETNKPKRPASPYSYYIIEQRKNHNLHSKNLFSELKDAWANLPEEEKIKYRSQYYKAKEKYDAELTEWKTKMIQEGREDVVSSSTEPKMSRIMQLKKKDPQ